MNRISLPTRKELETALEASWRSLLALGLVQLLLGAMAIVAPQAATRVGTEFLGGLLLVAGVAQAAWAFRVGNWKGFAIGLAGGVLNLAAGAVLLAFPADGAVAITLLVAAILIIDGVLRIGLGLRGSGSRGRRWLLPAGVVGVGAGLLLWWEWPGDSVWAVGLLLGVNLSIGGVALVGLALGSRGGGPPELREI